MSFYAPAFHFWCVGDVLVHMVDPGPGSLGWQAVSQFTTRRGTFASEGQSPAESRDLGTSEEGLWLLATLASVPTTYEGRRLISTPLPSHAGPGH